MVALRLLYAGRGVLDRLEEGLEVRADWGVDQDSLVEVPVPQRLDSAENENFAGLCNVKHKAYCMLRKDHTKYDVSTIFAIHLRDVHLHDTSTRTTCRLRQSPRNVSPYAN